MFQKPRKASSTSVLVLPPNFNNGSGPDNSLHARKLTWIPKLMVWKMSLVANVASCWVSLLNFGGLHGFWSTKLQGSLSFGS